ncbi:MAG: LamG domain-containing protein, partial [bacterium]|nr:LamG domain-containing protein [bacterium]
MERSTWKERVTVMRGRSQASTRLRGVAWLMFAALFTLNVAAEATEPFAEWKLDGNPDDTAGNYNSTVSGSVGYTTGVSGQALELSGESGFIAVPAVDFAGGDYSVTGSFKTSNHQSNHGAFFNLGDASTGGALGLDINYCKLRFAHRWPAGATGGVNLFSEDCVNDGAWHDYVVVKEGADIRLCIDGEQVATANDPTTIDNPEMPVLIGAWFSARAYDGLLDEIRVYNSALDGCTDPNRQPPAPVMGNHDYTWHDLGNNGTREMTGIIQLSDEAYDRGTANDADVASDNIFVEIQMPYEEGR